jgi:hypothetical protein
MHTVERNIYRDDDEKEAKGFGCKSIADCYVKSNHEFARYFILTQDTHTVATVLLQRDGHIIFFTSKSIIHHISLIKSLIRLAKRESKCAGPLITKTASWYKEALRINRLIGFWPYKLYSDYGFYVFGYKEIERLGDGR